MGKQIFHFRRNEPYLWEKRLCLKETHQDDDSIPATESLSASEQEYLKHFREKSLGTEYYGADGVSEVDESTLEAKKFVTLEARDQIHHVENEAAQLLDAKVTEELRAEIARIERIDPEKQERKLNKAMNKYGTPEKLDAEIRKINNKSSPKLKQKAIRLEQLRDKQEKTRQEEKNKLVFAHVIDADTLANNFNWLESAEINEAEGINDFKHRGYEKLPKLLPSSELAGWKKSEEMRILLFHLKSPNYRKILNGEETSDVRTNFGKNEKVTNLNKQTSELDKEFETPFRELEEVLDRIPGLTLNATKISLDILKTGDAETIDACLNYLEDTLSDQLEGQLGDQSAKVESTQIELERAKDSLTESKAKLEKKEAELRKIEEEKEKIILESEKLNRTALSKSTKTSTILDASGRETEIEKENDEAIYAREARKDLSAKEDRLDTRATQVRGEVTALEGTITQLKNNTEIQEKAKKSRESTLKSAKVEKNITSANKLVETIVSELKEKKNINLQIGEAEKAPREPMSPRQLFTNLEVELAKVDICRRNGLKVEDNIDTAALDDPKNKHFLAQAEKIGNASAKMKMEDFSGEALKRENSNLLASIAERNKTWKKTKGLKEKVGTLARTVGGGVAKKTTGAFNWAKEDIQKKTIRTSFFKAFREVYAS